MITLFLFKKTRAHSLINKHTFNSMSKGVMRIRNWLLFLLVWLIVGVSMVFLGIYYWAGRDLELGYFLYTWSVIVLGAWAFIAIPVYIALLLEVRARVSVIDNIVIDETLVEQILAKFVSKTLTDIINLVPSLLHTFTKQLAESLNVCETGVEKESIVNVIEVFFATDQTAKTSSTVKADLLAISDLTRNKLIKRISDAISFAEELVHWIPTAFRGILIQLTLQKRPITITTAKRAINLIREKSTITLTKVKKKLELALKKMKIVLRFENDT